MMKMDKAKAGLMTDECGEGQGMAEYAIVVSGVAVACVTVFKTIGTKVGGLLDGVTGKF